MVKIFLLIASINSFLFAQLIANKNIYFNQKISTYNTIYVKSKDIKCKTLNIKDIKKKNYRAIHYIKKGEPICKKDVKQMAENKVIYQFGSFIEIEEYGKVINETNRYIKIKKPNGKIKKLKKEENF